MEHEKTQMITIVVSGYCCIIITNRTPKLSGLRHSLLINPLKTAQWLGSGLS